MNTALKDQDVIEGVIVEDLPNLKKEAKEQKKTQKTKFKPVDLRTRKEKIVGIVAKYVGYLLGGVVLTASVAFAALGILGSYAGVPLVIGGLTWALLSLLGAGVIITPGLWLMGIGLILTGINQILRAFAA